MIPLHTNPTPTHADEASDESTPSEERVDGLPTDAVVISPGVGEIDGELVDHTEPGVPEPTLPDASTGVSASAAVEVSEGVATGAPPAHQSDAALEPGEVPSAATAPAAAAPPAEARTPVGAATIASPHLARWHPDSLQAARRRRPSKRLWFVIGGAALVLIAAVVTIVLLVTAAVPQRVEGLALLRDLPTKPVIGEWELAHPLADEVPAGDELYLNGYTAGRSTALLVWSTDRPLASADVDTAPGETMISLVNTANGHTLWDRRVTELSKDFDRFDTPVVVSPPDAAAIVVSQGELMVSLSRRDGRVVSTSAEHSSVEGIGFPEFAAPAAFVPALDGEMLVSSTTDGVGTIGRYRSTDLTDPVWQVTGDAGERATTAGDKLFFDGSVYSLDDGSRIDWKGDLSWYYQQLGRDLVAIDYSGNDTTVRGVDAATGAERWKVTGTLPVVLDGSGLLVVADQSGEQVRRLDPATGEVEWRGGLTSTWDGAYTVGDTIMLGDGDGGYTGISARDGEIRYEERDAAGSLVGYSDQTLVLALDGRLVGIDAMTGKRSWSVPAVGDQYGFAAWGGSPVAVASVLTAGSTEPAVLGVSDPSDR
ncbi:MAG TPA: PQQ-binding-like beta-propeller repeat protein [Plantibacter sp.]|uniref:outer membrane protein assembly factor BamB family protein n=1 Tax=unclassified Plantibacter TaxID=2624265 RepID=UPI002BDC270D|nr:PQQ-binding-like beta-propeller repeat protein [Plantibacter sp.]